MDKGYWKNFFARRFTSFRFTWSVFSLFFSFATFLIVFTDRFKFISIEWLMLLGILVFVVISILFDRWGIRQSINQSESLSSPISYEVYKDVKEIKEMIKKVD